MKKIDYNTPYIICGITYITAVVVGYIIGEIKDFPIFEIIIFGGLFCLLYSRIVVEMSEKVFIKWPKINKIIIYVVCLFFALAVSYGIVRIFLYILSFLPKI